MVGPFMKADVPSECRLSAWIDHRVEAVEHLRTMEFLGLYIQLSLNDNYLVFRQRSLGSRVMLVVQVRTMLLH
jgi:hypothetical protein